MSTSTNIAQKPAKVMAFENFISKLKHEAGKEVISEQHITQAIGQAVLLWLPTLKEEKDLTMFFAGIEIAGGTALARKIERHPLRPPRSRRSLRKRGWKPKPRSGLRKPRLSVPRKTGIVRS